MNVSRFRKLIGPTALGVCLLFSAAHPASAQKSSIDSLTGAVTDNEIATFKTAISGLVPGSCNCGNNYAYGNGGDAMEACGDMYDITHDLSILDELILYCDKVVSIRNTTKVMWTGNIDPIWPNDSTSTQWGCEQGDVAGHLAFCAQLIAQNPAIWNTSVGIGDPNGYGKTYRARASTYLQVVDTTMDLFYSTGFIHSDGFMQTPSDPPWPDPNSANDAVPWNQQGMICSALVRGASAHSLFNDGSSRITKFFTTAQQSAQRFIAQCRQFSYTKNGKTVAMWSYSGGNFAPGAAIHYVEDTAHGGYDISLLWRASHWVTGAVTQADCQMVADTLMEVVKVSGSSGFWNHVDGTGTITSGLKDSWSYLSEWRTDAFAATVHTGSQYYADAARKLWIKNARYKGWPYPATSLGSDFRIMNRNSGEALNVSGASLSDGANIIQWPYSADTKRNDEWQVISLGGGFFKILNRNSGEALNVSGASTADGAQVIQWPYSANSTTNDEWQIVDIGSGYTKILNRNSGKALNVSGGSTSNGALVIQSTYSSAAPSSDEWQVIAVP
jgi:hypothetical protein